MKKIFIILGVLVLIILGALAYKLNFNKDESQKNSHDGTYVLGGQKVTLKNGISEVEAAPGSASKIITRYFGNDLNHDIDGDGVKDNVFLVTQDMGGSGIFYYVVALLHTKNGSIGSEGLLLGDRIAPQNIVLDQDVNRKNVIIVNYADRKAGEDFTVMPSVGKSIYLKLDLKTLQWGEVVNNFEGEADPSKMALNMKAWTWVSTRYNDGKVVKPRSDKNFILTFKTDKTFSATTDCNGMGGEYTLSGNKLSITNIVSTMMYCEGSQESDFAKILSETESYLFTSKGELVLNLKFDSGSVVFR